MGTPLVSICCITYNHGSYIRQTIESFLMQETAFDVEIIINDDCSTDGTTEILLEYQRKYPNVVTIVTHQENEYSKGLRAMNLRNTFPRAKGKYIAMCEGDDYWTDPKKLTKQVDVLENDPSLMMCFHDSLMIFENRDTESILFSQKFKEIYTKERFTHEDINSKGWFISTPSMIFKREGWIYPQDFFKVYSGDFALHLTLTKYGDAFFIPECMSVARKHDGGVSQIQNKRAVLERRLAQERIFLKNVFKINKMYAYKRLAYVTKLKVKQEREYNTLERSKALFDLIKYGVLYFIYRFFYSSKA